MKLMQEMIQKQSQSTINYDDGTKDTKQYGLEQFHQMHLVSILTFQIKERSSWSSFVVGEPRGGEVVALGTTVAPMPKRTNSELWESTSALTNTYISKHLNCRNKYQKQPLGSEIG